MMFLDGKRVAFTGQLASMTRPEAADLIRAHGGTFITSVTKRTSFLVVGQEGWPLRKDGGLSDKLETAKHLQAAGCNIAILTEEELFERLGMEGSTSGIHKRFTLPQLGRLLKVPRNRLRAWIRAGLLNPVDTVQGMNYFDFHQVTGIRTLWNLTQAGVKVDTIRQSMKQLAHWLPTAEYSLVHLTLLERDGRLLTRLSEGQLAEPSGQLHFDFERPNEPVAADSPVSLSAAESWETGCRFEEQGQLQEAAHAYQEALYLGGPDAKICFNLANVYYQQGRLGQAAERYRQTTELAHDRADAWNNLGNVLQELGQSEDAVAAYRRALEIHSTYADAHYNLADALEQLDQFSQARRHWKEYLKHEPMGEWADYARRRLAN